jgi:tRNA 2-thiouridine synthesizing protein E
MNAGFVTMACATELEKEEGFMQRVEFQGKTFEIDDDGFLVSLDSWSPEWVEYVKTSEGIQELTEEHWKVIHFLQDFFRKEGRAPMVRVLTKTTGYKLRHVYELFPSGPGRGACKMAGLPKPTGCV